MQNVQQTVVSQYANSPILLAIIDACNEAIDPAADFERFLRLVWDLTTAERYGLEVWGRIVGVSGVLPVPDDLQYLGFETGLPDYAPLGQAVFFNGQLSTHNFTLSDDAYRTLIFVKAAANISACSAPVFNRLLQQLFTDRGACYCTDYGHMAMRLTFEFYLEPFEFSILVTSGAMPRPTGVKSWLLQLPQRSTFGFAEAGTVWSLPFGDGPMLSQTQGAVAAA